LYANGLTIASRQEIFVGALVLIDMGLASYLLYRLITERFANNLALYQSETYNGILFLFLIIAYALLRMVRTTGMIERLQIKQKSLLNNQKMKVYYRRVAWEEEDTVEDETVDGALDFEEVQKIKKNAGVNIGNGNSKVSPVSMEIAAQLQVLDGPGFSSENLTENYPGSHLRNLQYLKKSESLIDHIMSTILSQNISPRVYNVSLQGFVGLSVMVVICAVVPTAIKSSLGDGNWGT